MQKRVKITSKIFKTGMKVMFTFFIGGSMYNNQYLYNPQPSIDRINAQINELQKMKENINVQIVINAIYQGQH